VNEEALAHWGLSRQNKQTKKQRILLFAVNQYQKL